MREARCRHGAEAEGQGRLGREVLVLGGERLRRGLVALAAGAEVPVVGGEGLEVGEVLGGAGAGEAAAEEGEEPVHRLGAGPGGDIGEERMRALAVVVRQSHWCELGHGWSDLRWCRDLVGRGGVVAHAMRLLTVPHWSDQEKRRVAAQIRSGRTVEAPAQGVHVPQGIAVGFGLLLAVGVSSFPFWVCDAWCATASCKWSGVAVRTKGIVARSNGVPEVACHMARLGWRIIGEGRATTRAVLSPGASRCGPRPGAPAWRPRPRRSGRPRSPTRPRRAGPWPRGPACGA